MEQVLFIVGLYLGFKILDRVFIKVLKRQVGIIEGFLGSLVIIFIIAAIIGNVKLKKSPPLTEQEKANLDYLNNCLNQMRKGNHYACPELNTNQDEASEDIEDLERDPLDIYNRK